MPFTSIMHTKGPATRQRLPAKGSIEHQCAHHPLRDFDHRTADPNLPGACRRGTRFAATRLSPLTAYQSALSAMVPRRQPRARIAHHCLQPPYAPRSAHEHACCSVCRLNRSAPAKNIGEIEPSGCRRVIPRPDTVTRGAVLEVNSSGAQVHGGLLTDDSLLTRQYERHYNRQHESAAARPAPRKHAQVVRPDLCSARRISHDEAAATSNSQPEQRPS